MEHGFWLEAWKQGRIGFHRSQVNEDLLRHQERFLDGGPHRVLVPLCGKTLDLGWLADRGHQVVGVELSELAVQAFFSESGRPFETRPAGSCVRYESGDLTVLQGDLFDVQPGDVGPIDRIWDRASMIALPPEMRDRYVAHLRTLAGPGARILLSTLSYDQAVMSGPPFSVSEEEVRARYTDAQVERLDQQDILAAEPRWRERGHTWMHSTTYLIDLPTGSAE